MLRSIGIFLQRLIGWDQFPQATEDQALHKKSEEEPLEPSDGEPAAAASSTNEEAEADDAPGPPPERVTLYVTSMRAIRKTFDDCTKARQLLETYGIEIDERDVSMDSTLRQELRDRIGAPAPVPQLFIGDRHIGGISEITDLDDAQELKHLLRGALQKRYGEECPGCSGTRFVICPDCDGSRKLRNDDGEIETCGACNEAGLQRCSVCNVH